jgi:hypothetical protein
MMVVSGSDVNELVAAMPPTVLAPDARTPLAAL